MKKNQKILLLILLVCLAAGAVFIYQHSKDDTTPLKAVYVPFDGTYIMIDEYGSPFTIHFPEAIYDVSGKSIQKEDLRAGNKLKIYGDGIMLQSFPGQYPGVERIEVYEEGSPKDVAKYESLLSQIEGKDVDAVPALNIEYMTPDAIITVCSEPLSYDWKGETFTAGENVSANDVSFKKPADLTLIFTLQPNTVEIFRYPTDGSPDEKEAVEFSTGTSVVYDGSDPYPVLLLENVTGNFTYEVHAQWPQGTVVYSFFTIQN